MTWTTRSRIPPSSTTPPGGEARRRGLMTRRGSLAALVGLLLLIPGLPGTAGAQPSAEAAQGFIRSLGDEVLTIMRQGLGEEERLAELRRVLNQATDLDLVGRLVLGRYWRSATEEQRAAYTDLFRQYVMQNLASRLGTYQGESYDVTGAQVVDDRDALVSTRITRPGATPLRVDWRLRTADGDFAIIDVTVEGVSMVVSQRSEFASVIGNRGFDGLLDLLREQVGAARA